MERESLAFLARLAFGYYNLPCSCSFNLGRDPGCPSHGENVPEDAKTALRKEYRDAARLRDVQKIVEGDLDVYTIVGWEDGRDVVRVLLLETPKVKYREGLFVCTDRGGLIYYYTANVLPVKRNEQTTAAPV
jgi:hypothetical protein